MNLSSLFSISEDNLCENEKKFLLLDLTNCSENVIKVFCSFSFEPYLPSLSTFFFPFLVASFDPCTN